MSQYFHEKPTTMLEYFHALREGGGFQTQAGKMAHALMQDFLPEKHGTPTCLEQALGDTQSRAVIYVTKTATQERCTVLYVLFSEGKYFLLDTSFESSTTPIEVFSLVHRRFWIGLQMMNYFVKSKVMPFIIGYTDILLCAQIWGDITTVIMDWSRIFLNGQAIERPLEEQMSGLDTTLIQHGVTNHQIFEGIRLIKDIPKQIRYSDTRNMGLNVMRKWLEAGSPIEGIMRLKLQMQYEDEDTLSGNDQHLINLTLRAQRRAVRKHRKYWGILYRHYIECHKLMATVMTKE